MAAGSSSAVEPKRRRKAFPDSSFFRDLRYHPLPLKLIYGNICEHYTSLFDLIDKVPWSVAPEIMKNYSRYRWNYLVRQAHFDETSLSHSLEHMLNTHKIRNTSICSAVISNANWENHFKEKVYCVWVNLYEIVELNIVLCYTCFKALRNVFDSKNTPLYSMRDNFHMYCPTKKLHRVYRSPGFWCQNCFEELLFNVKTEAVCKADLHQPQSAIWQTCHTFSQIEDEESDIDTSI